MKTRFHYVPTADNPADEPSRDRVNYEYRLSVATRKIVWARHGPFSLDWMASMGTKLTDPIGKDVPYYSRSMDPGSIGVNVFANDVARDTEGKRHNGYCYPPFVMLDAVVAYAMRSKARLVLIHPPVPEPRPSWAQCLRGGQTMSLPLGSAEKRVAEGWQTLSSLSLECTYIDLS